MPHEKSITEKKNLIDYVKNKKGIFGFGLSSNINLDVLNIVILAFAGIVVKIFFQENYSQDGTIGPASTTIWGYGLTAIAMIILLFMCLYLIQYNLKRRCEEQSKCMEESNGLKNIEDGKGILESFKLGSFEYLKLVLSNVLPIFLTLFIIFYIIFLNFMFFNRINSNKVTDSYSSYSFMSTVLIVIQLILIVKYIYSDLDSSKDKDSKQIIFSKNLTYILSAINFVFVIILHILLAFYSTDG